MWIVAANVVQTRAKLEGSLKRCLQSRELTARYKGAEVIDAGFDLPSFVNAREPLLPVDLHQREEPECPHFSISLRKSGPSFAIKKVERFECRVGWAELNTAG